MTKNAEKILLYINALAACHGHPTAEDIFCHLRGEGERISLATVYNSLNTLTSDGAIRRIHVEGEPDRYDRTVRHDHLVCKRCGKLIDAYLPDITEKIERELGFTIEGYELKCLILCEECKNQPSKPQNRRKK